MSFNGIQGHGREIRALLNAVNGGRVAHAYLFAGPDGVGKGLVARAFAGALNCRSFDGKDACGACADCEAIGSGVHQNVIVLWPADKDGEKDPLGLIRIDEVRRLQAALKYKVDGGRKVAIVESADRLVDAAANAFLKTLEEPPPDSVIILLTSRGSELLPTILSRCQRVNFRPLSARTIAGILMEDEGVGREDAEFAARLSAGSVSSALGYARSGAYELRREVTERLATLSGGGTLEAMTLAGELARRDDLVEVLEFVKTWLRDRAVAAEGATGLATIPGAGGVQGSGPELKRALVDAFFMVEEARYDVTPPRYANRLLTMESLLFRLMATGALH